MYKCDICSKTYDSQRRYATHAKRCENREAGNMSDYSTYSGRSSGSVNVGMMSHRSRLSRRNSIVSINDAEHGSTTENSEYYRAAQQLSNDKKKLKIQLRKFSNELKHRVTNHRDEMEKIQEYYQEQINTLTEERDRLTDDLHIARDEMFDEKERVRTQYSEKLQAHREKLNKRYGNSTPIKRLENTIVTLQERLNDQLDERERMKDTLEKHFSDKEDAFQKEFAEKDDQLRTLRMEITQEREELRRLNRNALDEKERFKALCDKQKQVEINQILTDKHAAVTVIENAKTLLEKTVDTLQKQLEETKNQHVLDHQANETKFEKLVQSYNDSIKEERSLLEARSFQDKTKYERDLATAREDIRKELDQEKTNHAKDLQEVERLNLTKLEEADKKLCRSQDHLLEMKETMKQELNLREKKIRETLHGQVRDLQDRFDVERTNLNKKHKESEKHMSAEMTNLTDTAQKMEQQIAYYKNISERYKTDTDSVNEQFVKNLNEQGMAHKKALDEREQKIKVLEKTSQDLRDEFIKRLNKSQQQIEMADLKAANNIEEHNESKKLCKDKDNQIMVAKGKIMELEHRLKTSKVDFLSKMNLLAKEVEDVKNVDDGYKIKYEHARKVSRENEVKMNAVRNECQRLRSTHGDEMIRIKSETANKIRNLEDKLATTTKSIKSLGLFNAKEKQEMDQRLNKLRQKYELKLKSAEHMYEQTKASSVDSSNQLTLVKAQFVEQLNGLTKKMKDQVEEHRRAILSKDAEVDKFRKHLENVRSNVQKISVGSKKETLRERDRGQAELQKLKKDMEEILTIEKAKIDKSKRDVKDIRDNFASTMNLRESDHKKALVGLEQRVFDLQEALKKSRHDTSSKLQSDVMQARVANDTLSSRVRELQDLSRSQSEQIASLKNQTPQIRKEFASKEKELAERERKIIEEVKKLKKNPPTRLQDPSLKKSRDDALDRIRKQSVEINHLKADIVQLNDRVKLAETVVSEKDREKKTIIENNRDVKQGFVNTLNQNSVVHKRELTKKDDRISELEQLLMSKIKMAEVVREERHA